MTTQKKIDCMRSAYRAFCDTSLKETCSYLESVGWDYWQLCQTCKRQMPFLAETDTCLVCGEKGK